MAQPANVGVGDQVTYNGATIAYISGRASSTQYSLITATGGTPANVGGATVNSIRRAFNSLSAAEANSTNASHLNAANLVAGNYQLNWPCYKDAPMNDQVTIGGYTTGASNFIRVYTPVYTNQVGTSQRHTGKARTGFRLQPTGAIDNDSIRVFDSFVRIEGLEIDGSLSTAPNGAGGVSLETFATAPVGHYVSHNIIYETRNFTGIYVGSVSARVWNNVLHNVNNTGLGALVMDQPSGTAYFFYNTVYNHAGNGIARLAGTLVAKNNVSMNPGAAFDFGGAITQSNNVSSDASAGGAGSQINKTAYASYFQNTTAGLEDLRLRNTSLTLWGSNGADLSADANLAVSDDIEGSGRIHPDIGADEFGPGAQMRVLSGTYTGNGIDNRAIFVGFQPDVVIVDRFDPTNPITNTEAVIRSASMAGDASKNIDDASTGGLALAPNLVQSLDALGFSIGTNNNVNQAGLTYYWIAFKGPPDELKVGTYAGTGVAQDITSVGFAPAYLVVMSAGPRNAVQKSASMPATFSQDFISLGYTTAILNLRPDGFRVGTHLTANENAATYHYVAWAALPGKVSVGSYTGGAPADNRNINGTGFLPEWVIVSRSSNAAGAQGHAPAHKPASSGILADTALLFGDTLLQADNIQSLQANGFQVGSQARVNSAGAPNNYHWAAFGSHEPQVNYRAIGTGGPHSAGTITATVGSTIVTGVGTGWKTANRGRGDSISFGAFTGTILSVDSETQLTLTSPSTVGGSLPYTISRKFMTLSAWEDCIDGGGTSCGPDPVVPSADLVADDRREVGIAYKDSPFLIAGDIFIQGSTTDATHTILLTADSGNRHNGVAGAGVVVDAQAGPQEFSIQDSNVTVDWLEFRGCRGAIGLNAVEIRADASDLATNVLVQNLLVHDFDDPTPGHDSSGIALSGDLSSLKSVTIRNTMIWDGDNYGIEGDNSADSAIIENVSIDGMTNSGIWAGNSAFTIRNTVVTSSGTADFARDTSGSLAGSNNTDSDGSGAVFFTNSITAAAPTIFVAPNADLHLLGGANSQVDSGLDRSASFVNDIDGQSRSGLTWDRGADERDAPAIATADLGIAKDDGQPTAVPGQAVTYTITVTNNGPDTLNSVKVIDSTPSLLSPVFAPSSGSYDGATGVWTGLNLAASQSVVLTLSGTIDPFARGNLVNTATVAPPPGVDDPAALNDSATDTDTLEPSADVRVVKTDDVDPAPLGGLLSYTLTVTNNGPSSATSVTVQDPLPPDMDLDAGPGAIVPSQGTCNYDGPSRTVSCDLGSLGPTLAATVAIKVRPQALRVFSNTATTSRDEPDPAPGNDAESETTSVEVSSLDVRFFTATSTNQRNVLEWINPTDPNYASTEIVVRGDHFPTGPGDGATIYNLGTGGSGGRVKLPHPTGALSNGLTFYYGAFVHRSAAPFVSPGRFVTGRPFDHTASPVKWAFSTGATALTPPTVGGAGVIGTSNDKVIYAMERGIDDDQLGVDSGEWPAGFEPAPVGGPVQLRSPVVPVTVGGANPVVYVGSQDGSVYAIDATAGGSVAKWVKPIGPMVQAAPAGIFSAFGGSFDYLLVGTRDSTGPNAFFALDPFSGNEIERFDNGGAGPGEIGIVNGMAAVDYGPPLPPRVYFTNYERLPGGSTITLRCFELDSMLSPPVFNQIWARALGNIDSSPVLRNGRIYVGSPAGGGTLYSLDALTGGDDRTFLHNNGQVKGFVFPDRASNDVYFATDDFVWGVTDGGGPVMTNRFAGPIILPLGAKPSPVLFTPGSHYLYVGGSDGKLYEIDVQPAAPTLKQLLLGNGLAAVGAPSLDREHNLIHVGSEAGIFYAVQIPLPP